MVSFTSLPDELLQQIVAETADEYNTVPVELRLVCRRLTAVSSSYIFSTANITGEAFVADIDRLLGMHPATIGGIRDVEINFTAADAPPDVAAWARLSRRVPNVTALTIAADSDSFMMPLLEATAVQLRGRLRYINLKLTSFDHKSTAVWSWLAQLRALDDVTLQSLSTVLPTVDARVPSLESVTSLRVIIGDTPSGEPKPMLEWAPKLKHLEMRVEKRSNLFKTILAGVPDSLRVLKLDGLWLPRRSDPATDIQDDLERLTSLEALVLRDRLYDPTKMAYSIRALQQLRTIVLDASAMDDPLLYAILDLPLIENLIIEGSQLWRGGGVATAGLTADHSCAGLHVDENWVRPDSELSPRALAVAVRLAESRGFKIFGDAFDLSSWWSKYLREAEQAAALAGCRQCEVEILALKSRLF